jgi:hypothetical protein
MTLEDFNMAEFPPVNLQHDPFRGFVYVLCLIIENAEVPFYVGQTSRLSGRMRDYSLANFTASTDFCVGEAIKYLKDERSYRIVVRYTESSDPRRQEKIVIRRLLVSGVWLLNCLPRYDYRTDNRDMERDTVRKFCDMVIESRELLAACPTLSLRSLRR